MSSNVDLNAFTTRSYTWTRRVFGKCVGAFVSSKERVCVKESQREREKERKYMNTERIKTDFESTQDQHLYVRVRNRSEVEVRGGSEMIEKRFGKGDQIERCSERRRTSMEDDRKEVNQMRKTKNKTKNLIPLSKRTMKGKD